MASSSACFDKDSAVENQQLRERLAEMEQTVEDLEDSMAAAQSEAQFELSRRVAELRKQLEQKESELTFSRAEIDKARKSMREAKRSAASAIRRATAAATAGKKGESFTSISSVANSSAAVMTMAGKQPHSNKQFKRKRPVSKPKVAFPERGRKRAKRNDSKQELAVPRGSPRGNVPATTKQLGGCAATLYSQLLEQMLACDRTSGGGIGISIPARAAGEVIDQWRGSRKSINNWMNVSSKVSSAGKQDYLSSRTISSRHPDSAFPSDLYAIIERCLVVIITILSVVTWPPTNKRLNIDKHSNDHTSILDEIRGILSNNRIVTVLRWIVAKPSCGRFESRINHLASGNVHHTIAVFLTKIVTHLTDFFPKIPPSSETVSNSSTSGNTSRKRDKKKGSTANTHASSLLQDPNKQTAVLTQSRSNAQLLVADACAGLMRMHRPRPVILQTMRMLIRFMMNVGAGALPILRKRNISGISITDSALGCQDDASDSSVCGVMGCQEGTLAKGGGVHGVMKTPGQQMIVELETFHAKHWQSPFFSVLRIISKSIRIHPSRWSLDASLVHDGLKCLQLLLQLRDGVRFGENELREIMLCCSMVIEDESQHADVRALGERVHEMALQSGGAM
eukprot:g2548.t1